MRFVHIPVDFFADCDIIKQEYFGEGVTMQKKAVKDNARKNIILKAASKRFISDGFEGTSIRSIMEEASA